MLKSLKSLLLSALDFFLPERKDFSLVKMLDEGDVFSLPKAPPIEGHEWIHPLFHYKNEKVRAIIWELKYKEVTLPLGHIGKMLYDEIVSVISEVIMFNNDAQFVLLPIPITSQRRIERGFNQSEYIAKAILENDIVHILLYAPQWFQKCRETPKQSRSESREERRNNLAECFEADQRLEGKYIILIDDVATTGSTLDEARRTLISIGARDVFAFTIAH